MPDKGDVIVKELNYALRNGVLPVRRELCSINLYLVLLMAFFWIQYNLAGLSGYLADSKGQMNIFELYVHFLSFRSSQIVYLFEILAVSCGTLFYSGGAAYYLIRGNRRRWVLGQAVYLLLVTAGYNLFLLSSFCFSTGGRLTLANEWSTASVLAEQFGTRVMGCEGFRIYHTVMQDEPGIGRAPHVPSVDAGRHGIRDDDDLLRHAQEGHTRHGAHHSRMVIGYPDREYALFLKGGISLPLRCQGSAVYCPRAGRRSVMP